MVQCWLNFADLKKGTWAEVGQLVGTWTIERLWFDIWMQSDIMQWHWLTRSVDVIYSRTYYRIFYVENPHTLKLGDRWKQNEWNRKKIPEYGTFYYGYLISWLAVDCCDMLDQTTWNGPHNSCATSWRLEQVRLILRHKIQQQDHNNPVSVIQDQWSHPADGGTLVNQPWWFCFSANPRW